MPPTRTSAPSTSGIDAFLCLLFTAFGAALAFESFAWLSGNLTNALAGDGSWAPLRATDTLMHPHMLWPHLGPLALLISARIVPGLAVTGLATAAVTVWLRLRGPGNGLARASELSPLLPKAVTVKAQSLRPSLAGRSWKRGGPS